MKSFLRNIKLALGFGESIQVINPIVNLQAPQSLKQFQLKSFKIDYEGLSHPNWDLISKLIEQRVKPDKESMSEAYRYVAIQWLEALSKQLKRKLN